MPQTPVADRAAAVFIHDLHDAAYHIWRRTGGPPRPLVHLDAHHDAERIGPFGLHIGNFVRVAIRERLVSDVYWVVPDPVWRSASSRSVLASELREIGDHRPIGWRAAVDGVPVTVGTLADLPVVTDPVHLDIDIDYLLVQERRRKAEDSSGLPWIWPHALARELSIRVPRPDVITIATSVSGGFTPLAWQHFAQDLAMRLRGDTDDNGVLEAFSIIERAATLETALAISELRRGAGHHPGSAPVLFHLANLLQRDNQLDEGRAVFARAVAIDPAYRHPYRSRGPLEQAAGRWRAARAEYDRALLLDPADPFPRLGLAQLAREDRRFDESRRLFEDTVKLPGGDRIEAWRGLAGLLARTDPPAAIRAYERSLQLALNGQVPLSAPLCTNAERHVIDPGHCDTYGRIAELQETVGNLRSAALNYVLAASVEPRYRIRLGWLRLRTGSVKGFQDCALGSFAWLARTIRRAAGGSERPWYNPGPP
jgi:tetratricopeptide (TPR) repeat protein